MTPVELLSHVLNHPDVLPALAPGHASVPIGFATNLPTVMFGDERGLALFFLKAPGIYNGHFCYTKALRGREALFASRNHIAALFTQHAAKCICGAVPRTNRASRVMARALGFRPVGTSTDSQGRACINYVLERDTWATSSAACSAEARHSK